MDEKKNTYDEYHKKYYNDNKENLNKQRIENTKKTILNKVHKCEECDRGFQSKKALQRHLKIKKHNPERYVHYECPFIGCTFETKYKSSYTRHYNRKKHEEDRRIADDVRVE